MSTAEYFSRATNPVSPRPAYGVLDLAKIQSTGFSPADADETLEDYVQLENGTNAVARPAIGIVSRSRS